MHEFYLRLSVTEKEAYLRAILEDDDESDRTSDEDDDWLPDEVLPERTPTERRTCKTDHRFQNLQVMRNYSTTIAIESVIGQPINPVLVAQGPAVERDASGRRKIISSCHICYKQAIKKRRKTRETCSQCDQPICDEHAVNFAKCREYNQ